MFRTRILEVVCFLETCFFRVDVRAGLGVGERVQVTRGVSRRCPTLTHAHPPKNQCLSSIQVRALGASADEAEMSREEGSLPRGMRTTAGFTKQLWVSGQHTPP